MKKKQFKIGKRELVISEAIFKRKVNVLLNFTPADFEKWCKKKGDKEYKDDGKERDFTAFSCDLSGKDKPTEWIICMKHFDWTIKDQGTLIHEIVHTVVKIFQCNNIPFNNDTQEFLAHNIGNIYEDICRKILNKKT